MSLGVKIAGGGVAIAVVAGAFVLMRTEAQRAGNAQPTAEKRAALAEPEPVVIEDEERLPTPEALSERVPAGANAAEESEPEAAVEAATIALAGRVLGVDGVPLVGVGVRVRRWEEVGSRATTDGSGRFVIECERQQLPVSLEVDDDRYASLRAAHVRRSTMRREHVIVASRAADLRGRVVDEYGQPLANAGVSLVYHDGLLVDFPLVLDTTTRVQPRVDTDADGRFELGRAAVAAGCELRAESQGYWTAQVELVEPYSNERTIELRALPAGEITPQAEGRVLLPDGTPAAGATVRYGSNDTKTDGSGRFQLPLDDAPAPDLQLAAGLEGYGTAIIEGFGELQAQAAPYAPASVTLVLRESSLSLSGRVVDVHGTGLSGWQVQLEEGTPLTRRQTPPFLAEALDGGSTSVETTDSGGFELNGLLDRDYGLLAYHPKSLVALRAGPFAAGARDVVLAVPSDLVHPRVAGRVVSRRGQPVGGARVSVGLVLHRMENGLSWISGDLVQTGPDGRFELFDVARTDVHLDVGGENVVPLHHEFERGRAVEDLVIEVALRCHFRVEVQGDDLDGLGVQIEDGEGKRVTIKTFTATGSSGSSYKRLVDGRMEVSAVSEDATQLILLRGHGADRQELARRELHLVPGEVSEVRIELE